MEAVVVVDMGNEEVSNEKKFQNWFNEHGCKLNDDNIYVMVFIFSIFVRKAIF